MRGFLSIVIILVVVVGAIMFFSRGKASPQTSVDGTTDVGIESTGLTGATLDDSILVGDARNAKGSEDAKVTIVEFSDFQCPYCQLASGKVKSISEKYGDDVRIIFRHFPLNYHELAEKAAEATEAAGTQGKFWEMHYLIYENQDTLTSDSFIQFAQELELDSDLFKQDLESGKYSSVVKNDHTAGVNIGVSGTPSFYINGRKANISTFDELDQIIDDFLKK